MHRKAEKRSKSAKKKEAKSLLCLVLVSAAALGCSSTKITWVGSAKAAAPRCSREIRVFYTRKAVGRPFDVVARYRLNSRITYVRSRPNLVYKALNHAKKRAARDGCDAVVVNGLIQWEDSVLSWIMLFIPVKEMSLTMEVIGVRFRNPPQGART